MRRRGWSRVALARTVIVNLDDGSALRGSLIRETRRLLTFANAELREKDAPASVKLDGETVIDSERIRFAQIIT
jgi:small nuclear ribonucleoprotein (snRNP)-like protein